MQIHSAADPAFKAYGRILEGYDTAELTKAMEKIAMPAAGTAYEPGIESLEACAVFADLRDRAYGGMPIQLGMCWGHNTKLNCLEYHRDSEVNIGTKDFILLLGKFLFKINIAPKQKIGCFYRVDIFEFHQGSGVISEPVFFYVKWYQNAVYITNKIVAISCIPCVVGEHEIHFTFQSVGFGNFAYRENVLVSDHSTLLIIAPSAASRPSISSYPRSICSMLLISLMPLALKAAISRAIPARISGLDNFMPFSCLLRL